jgi:nucleoid-associated protein YgaU
MTAPAPTPRSVPFASSTAAARRAGGTRGLFIAVAVLGLGGAAAGWLLTHSSEAPVAGAVPEQGAVVDPLAPVTVAAAQPVAALGSSVASGGAAVAPPALVQGGKAGAAGAPTGGQTLSTGGSAGIAAGIAGAPNPQAAPAASVFSAGQRVQQAVAMIATDPIRARAELTALLDGNGLSVAERAAAYQGINSIAEQVFFSPRIVPGDTVSQSYVVKRGDSLARIAKSEGLGIDWRFLQRINALASERALRPDMRLKLVHGPFHAEVVKADFRLNLYAGEGTERVMVASLPCGLGENDGTPVGTFKVRPGSKNINPEWRNPRTGEYFAANDPKNPIGERWIGLAGATPETARFTGYGIHGTVDPTSIGRNASMGCVRLGDAEVQVAYELIGDASTVVIR